MTAAATRRGVIMGTAAYMSPEQARGKVVDWRTDVWTFGCVLYEMLAGQQLFSGDTLTDVLAAIVTKAPDWTLLPRATPASVRTVLRRCLTGDLKRRAQHVGDVRIEIDEALQGRYNGTDPVFVPATASPGGGMRWAAGLGIAGVVLGALTASAVFWSRSVPPPEMTRSPVHVGHTLPAGLEMPLTFSPTLAMSPDGGRIVFQGDTAAGERQLYLLDLATGTEARPLDGTQGGRVPFFSPDGDSIGFIDSNLTLRSYDMPQFSPDGDSIAVVNREAAGAGASGYTSWPPAGEDW